MIDGTYYSALNPIDGRRVLLPVGTYYAQDGTIKRGVDAPAPARQVADITFETDDLGPTEQANFDGWNESIRRRWATYWARHARGLGAPWPNEGGWRCPTWNTYWTVSWRVDGRLKVVHQRSHGAGKKALKRAHRRGHTDARLGWYRMSPEDRHDR